MTKRLLDKKIVKIAFTESPDDQEDYNCSWDLNFSSDEDTFFKGKSEILWSRTGNYFDYSDSPQSFTDLTGRTLSSCSWHNDEFDMKSTSKVRDSLEAIDTALYEKIKLPSMNEIVFQECCDWAEKFSYFRIKGEQIINHSDDNLNFCSLNTMSVKQCDLIRPNTSLHLEGRKLPIHGTSKPKEVYFDYTSDNKVPNMFEKVLEEDAFEECFALHESDGSEENSQVPMIDNVRSVSTIKAFQETILDKLVLELWPSIKSNLAQKIKCTLLKKFHISLVVDFLEKFSDKNNVKNDLQLPPINIVTEQKKALNMQRPKTEGCGSFSTEFPKLENILTVSPKILQKRELGNGYVSHIARPNSEMSVNVCLSSKSLATVSHQQSVAHVTSENVYSKESRYERESDNLCFVLPALEEDFQETSNFLRGFHIEPGKKESSLKPALSSRNEYEAVSTSRTSEYFLPPIKNKRYTPANAKLTKNLFTFYGSSIVNDKSRTLCSAKFKKSNSRPNTSISKKTIKNEDVIQHLPIKNGLCITAKNIGKNSPNSNAEKSTEVSQSNDIERIEESHENSVTLFPIVTSLIPQEDKNHLSKKGLLHNFLGGKKR